jgi:hypothetical protein
MFNNKKERIKMKTITITLEKIDFNALDANSIIHTAMQIVFSIKAKLEIKNITYNSNLQWRIEQAILNRNSYDSMMKAALNYIKENMYEVEAQNNIQIKLKNTRYYQ